MRLLMPLKDPKNQKLIQDFLIEHSPLINQTIKHLRGSGKIPEHIEDDDLHFAGFHGLMEAVHRYQKDVAGRTSEEGSGNVFAKYAKTRIRGKMLDVGESQNQIPAVARKRAKNLEALSQPGAPVTTPSTPVPDKKED